MLSGQQCCGTCEAEPLGVLGLQLLCVWSSWVLFFLGHCILSEGSEYTSTAVATKLGRKGGSKPRGQSLQSGLVCPQWDRS